MDCCSNHEEFKEEKNPQMAMGAKDGTQKHHHASDPAGDFLKRFFAVTVLLIPLVFLSKTSLRLLGITDFSFRSKFQFIIVTIVFYYAFIFFEHAKHEIKSKSYGMMTLVSVAVGAGYLFSAASTFIPSLNTEFYIEISTLIWILLFGHYLEAKSSVAAGDALSEVAKLLPKKAHLLVNGKEKDVDIENLKEGDIVRIKAGEKAPADGTVLSGKASFNESLVSGESKLITKEKDNKVIAGAICEDGSLEMKLDRVGEKSTIGQIQKLIKEAKKTKPSSQAIADKVAGILTFTALSVSVLTIVVWSLIVGQTFVFSLTLAITVLVIACPHALGLAIPTVSTIATTLAVKNGLFIKNLRKIEEAKDIDYVIFDKTGTLTKGSFGVSKIVNFYLTEKEILSLAASLEQNSSHPIARSIIDNAENRKAKFEQVTDFRNVKSMGISGRIKKELYYLGNASLMKKIGLWDEKLKKLYGKFTGSFETTVFLGDSRKVLGIIILSDEIKNESFEAVKSLHKLGVKTVMITGDNEESAKTVANKLNIDKYFAGVLPENKYKYVKKLQAEKAKILMVGDGVNDAPALTQANIGVAIGAGTEIAIEAGDVVLTKNNPLDVVKYIILSKKVYRKMQENLFWALGYNILAIPSAAGLFIPLGFRLKPEIGAILMSLSSVVVVVNALTLKKVHLEVK